MCITARLHANNSITNERLKHATLIPGYFICCTIDTVMGLGASIASFCTLGANKKIDNWTTYQLSQSSFILSKLFQQFLLTLNPKNSHLDTKKNLPFGCNTKYVHSWEYETIQSSKSAYWLRRHLSTRLKAGLFLLACIITRTIDAIIGIIAACLSLLALGYYKRLNQIAFEGLQFPGVVFDIYVMCLDILNPFRYQKNEILQEIKWGNMLIDQNRIPNTNVTCSMSIVKAYENGIVDLHNRQKQLKNFDVNLFEQARNKLKELNNLHESLWQQEKHEEALQLKKTIDRCTIMIQEMNTRSSKITQQDVDGVKQAFFVKPVEKFYFDEKTEQQYWTPDHSQLLILLINFAKRDFM